jgi:hypothetical protein
MEEVELRNTCYLECHCTVSAYLSVHSCELQVIILERLSNQILTSLDLARDSKNGLILMHGGQVGLQKSTARAGDSLISF